MTNLSRDNIFPLGSKKNKTFLDGAVGVIMPVVSQREESEAKNVSLGVIRFIGRVPYPSPAREQDHFTTGVFT
jgi:hypothetical protein